MNSYTLNKSYKERRTYLTGKLFGKYIGYLDPEKSDLKFKKYYDLEITEAKITTLKDPKYIRKWDKKEHDYFKNIELSQCRLPEEITLEIISKDRIHEHFKINIHDPKLTNINLYNQTYEEDKVFGDISALISGYILHYEEYEILTVNNKPGENEIEESVKCKTNKKTGRHEERKKYIRHEYYYSDGTTYWGEWLEKETQGSTISLWQTILDIARILIIAVFLIPLLLIGIKIFIPILIILIASYALSLVWSFIVNIFKVVFPVVGAAFIIFTILGTINILRNSLKTNKAEYIPTEATVDEQNQDSDFETPKDSIISNFVSWTDYANNHYSATIKIRLSDFNESYNFRNNIPLDQVNTSSYDMIVQSISNFDKGRLDLIYKTLDSIRHANKINRFEFPKVIVSMIQDIPYTLISNGNCAPESYTNNDIRSYLVNGGRCREFVRFGLLSPVEFMSSLDGDCDTRALLLFTVLNHFNYDVVMLTSEYYKHSMIGINLPYKGVSKTIHGRRYVVWETTNKGFPPGDLPIEISNMRFWNPSLFSNQFHHED